MYANKSAFILIPVLLITAIIALSINHIIELIILEQYRLHNLFTEQQCLQQLETKARELIQEEPPGEIQYTTKAPDSITYHTFTCSYEHCPRKLTITYAKIKNVNKIVSWRYL